MHAISEMTYSFHNPKQTVVLWDQPVVALQSLHTLVVMKETEKDPIADLVVNFSSVMISVFLHLMCSTCEGFSHLL